MAATTSRFSRFPIHDELTAPEGSVPVLRGALSSAGTGGGTRLGNPSVRRICITRRGDGRRRVKRLIASM